MCLVPAAAAASSGASFAGASASSWWTCRSCFLGNPEVCYLWLVVVVVRVTRGQMGCPKFLVDKSTIMHFVWATTETFPCTMITDLPLSELCVAISAVLT